MFQVTELAVAVMLPLMVMLVPAELSVQLLKVTVLPLTVPQELRSAALRSALLMVTSPGRRTGTPELPKASEPSTMAKSTTEAPDVAEGELLNELAAERFVVAVEETVWSDKL